MKVGKVHKIGMNQRVRDKLPKLPAKNVKASHCISVSIVCDSSVQHKRTLSGSARVKIVTSGM